MKGYRVNTQTLNVQRWAFTFPIVIVLVIDASRCAWGAIRAMIKPITSTTTSTTTIGKDRFLLYPRATGSAICPFLK
jgi:hypothetical protein